MVEGGEGLEMASSTILKPRPGTHSVLVSRNVGEEEGTALGERESPKWVPEYALEELRYVFAVRREGSRDTLRVLRSGTRCRRSRILRRTDIPRVRPCRPISSSDSETGEMALPLERACVGLADKGRELEDTTALVELSREGGAVPRVLVR